MVFVFLYLRALRNGCSESFDARHVRYPSARLDISPKAVVAHVQTRHRPDGETNIRGRTGDGLCVLAPTCTWK